MAPATRPALDALRPTASGPALGELVQQLAQLVESISPGSTRPEPTLDRVPAEPTEPGDAAGRVWGADAEQRFEDDEATRRTSKGPAPLGAARSASPPPAHRGRSRTWGGLGKTALVAKDGVGRASGGCFLTACGG